MENHISNQGLNLQCWADSEFRGLLKMAENSDKLLRLGVNKRIFEVETLSNMYQTRNLDD